MDMTAMKPPVVTLSAGPVQSYPNVLQALAQPIGYDFDPSFQAFYEETALKCARAMRQDEPALILQAEPAVAIEAAAASLISADDVVLNLASGVYGKGFGYWSARYHKSMVEIEVPFNDAISPAAVEAALRDHPEISVVSVVHHDTPSGTLNPIVDIGRLVADHGALLIVDAVSSFGGMDIHPGDCHADIFITGPGKCLGGTPGITFVAVSEAAWEHMEGNSAAPRASALSYLDWRNAWSRSAPFPFTPSTAEVCGLAEAVDHYFREGPEEVWRRHALTARACREGLKACGAALWAAREEIASPSTTAIEVPDGLRDTDIFDVARRDYGVVFSLGRGATAGKLLRIGHMGPTAEPAYAFIAVAAMAGALRKLGFPADVGKGIEAALAVIDNQE